MSNPSEHRRSARGLGTRGRGASKTSADRPALADLVRDIHRQLEASQPLKVRGRSTPVMPPLIEILASIDAGARGDAGGSPEVLAK